MANYYPPPGFHFKVEVLGLTPNDNDVRFTERSNFDRAYPGDERGVAPAMIAALIQAGYKGWYELEIFSDDGTFGNDFPDSFWKIPHEHMLATAKAKFDAVWARAQELVVSERSPASSRASAPSVASRSTRARKRESSPRESPKR